MSPCRLCPDDGQVGSNPLGRLTPCRTSSRRILRKTSTACCVATREAVDLVGDGEFDGGGGGEAGAGERGLVDDGAVGPLGGGEVIYFAAKAGGIEAALGVGF